MSGAYFPLCLWCKHLDVKYNEQTRGWRCEAFPVIIPDEIIECKVLHLDAYEGDNGVQFERQPDESLMPAFFVKLLNTKLEYTSDILLQMTIDQMREKLDWRWDPKRYPKKTDVKTDE
jgi:hypothetical protein